MYYNAPTSIALYIDVPTEAGFYYGKKWFDWKSDLPQEYYKMPGNGVQGGRMTVHATAYDVDEKDHWDFDTYDVHFCPVGSSTYFYYDGGDFNISTPFDNYDEDGLYFWSAFTGWGESRRLKVRVMYTMELMVAEHYYSWYC